MSYDYEIKRLKTLLNSKEETKKALVTSLSSNEKKLKELKTKLTFYSKLLENKLQEKTNIENILTNIVNEMFSKQDEIKIDLIYDKEDNLKGIKLLVSSDGTSFNDILEFYGEGEVTCVVIILNILLLMVNETVPKFIVFDEPFAFLNPSYHEKMNQFIQSIVEDTGIQIILLTHQSNPMGKIVQIRKKNGSSYVAETDNV